MPKQYVRQTFMKGLNRDASPATLDFQSGSDVEIQEVADSANVVYERGIALVRPQIAALGSPAQLASTQNVFALANLPFVGASGALGASGLLGLVANATPTWKLYKFCTDQFSTALFTPTEITGAGIANTWDNFFFTLAVANGVVLIPGHPSGLVRWDPSTMVYTQIAAAPYSFITSMYSRAVAAYKLTGALTDPITVAYSATGDETNWASLGAGSTVLSDVPDVITGLANLRNVLVIPRTYGISLGYPTGTFPQVFNFTNFSNSGIGCCNPATFKVFDNVAYFVSTCGIHSFDLTSISNIGEGIYTDIMAVIQQYGGALRGFISRSYKLDYQPTYNLFLDITANLGGPLGNTIYHYQYNITERKWSKHLYSSEDANTWSSMPFPFDYKSSTVNNVAAPPQSTVGVLRRVPGTAPLFRTWSGTVSDGSTAFITTGNITLAAPVIEATLTRVMIVFAAVLANPQFSVQVQSTLNGVVTTVTKNVSTTRIAQSSPLWDRVWVDVRAPGNMFVVSLGSTPPILPPGLQVKEILMEFSVQGTERG